MLSCCGVSPYLQEISVHRLRVLSFTQIPPPAHFSQTAIDEMAERLVGEDGSFNYELFSALNNDDALIAEIEAGNSASNAGSPSGSTPTTSATS